MSGHSRWSNIKRTKGKADAAKAANFTKIGRELMVAVKAGGADPNSNSALRTIIAKARACNIPNDNIMRTIKKASGELGSINYERVVYEGYGVGGSAVMVDTLTDNRNRTASDIRHLFDKFGGSLGTTGCVSFMFTTQDDEKIPQYYVTLEGDALDRFIAMIEKLDELDDVQEIYHNVEGTEDGEGE